METPESHQNGADCIGHAGVKEKEKKTGQCKNKALAVRINRDFSSPMSPTCDCWGLGRRFLKGIFIASLLSRNL